MSGRTKADIMAGIPEEVRGKIVRSRKLANNTVEYIYPSEGGAIKDEHGTVVDYGIVACVRLHDTDIIKRFGDGTVRLDSGGWRTITTKDRLQNFMPRGRSVPRVHVYQANSVWYVAVLPAPNRNCEERRVFFFEDGMQIAPDGSVWGAQETGEHAERKRKRLKRRIQAYVGEYMKRLAAGKVPRPSTGDCWYCSMVDEKGLTLGETSGTESQRDHLLKHMREGYYVPSMVVRAVMVFTVYPAAEAWLAAQFSGRVDADPNGIGADQVRKSLTRWLYRQFGFAS